MKTKNAFRQACSSSVLCLAVVAIATPVHAQKEVTKTFSMPVQVEATVNMAECENSPGPQITLDGVVRLGGLTLELIFRNNVKGTHTYTDQVVVDAVAVAPGETLVIPKQPVLGGVGGNPFIWVQMVNGAGAALTEQVFLGRCVQGPFRVNAVTEIPVVALAEFAALDCSNNPGPYITVDGAMGFGQGLKARFIFRNNDNPVDGPHQAVRTTDAVLIPGDFVLQFPKQPVLGGVGGNPWIWVLFEEGDGTAIGKEVLLGRCVQLAPGN